METNKPFLKAAVQAYFYDLEEAMNKLEEDILSKIERSHSLEVEKISDNIFYQHLLQKITTTPLSINAIVNEEIDESSESIKSPEDRKPILKDEPTHFNSKASLKKTDTISKMFKNRKSLPLNSEMMYGLLLTLQRDTSLMEEHIQQISTVLFDLDSDSSEGFLSIVFSCCSNSLHFSLLLYLALSYSADTRAFEPENQSRKSKCEWMRYEIEKIVKRNSVFFGNRVSNLKLRSLLSDNSDNFVEQVTSSSTPSYPNVSEILCSFYVGYTDETRNIPRQGRLVLTDKSIHFNSKYSKATLNKWIHQIQDVKISDNLLIHSCTIHFSERVSCFYAHSHQEIIRLHKILMRLVAFNNPSHSFAALQAPSAVKIEETFYCMTSLKYSREFFNHQKKSNINTLGSFAIFRNESGRKFESGDGIMLPYSFLGSLLFSDSTIPLLLRLSNPTKPELFVYASVFNFYSPVMNAILPEWMISHLNLISGDKVKVQVVKPSEIVKQVQLEVQNFDDSSNENSEVQLINFGTITKNSIIPVLYRGRTSLAKVTSTVPDNSFVLNSNTQVKAVGKLTQSPNKLVELNSPIKDKLKASTYHFYSIPIPKNDEDFSLDIECNLKKVEIFLSTVKSKPDAISSEWSASVVKFLTIDLSRSDFLVESPQFIYFSLFTPFESTNIQISLRLNDKEKKKDRFEFLKQEMTFLQELTKISSQMRLCDENKRKDTLKILIDGLNEVIPIGVYIPLCQSTNQHHCVVKLNSEESTYFSTWNKVPVLLVLEVVDTSASCSNPLENIYGFSSPMNMKQRIQYITEKSKKSPPKDQKSKNSSDGKVERKPSSSREMGLEDPDLSDFTVLPSDCWEEKGEELKDLVFGESWNSKQKRIKAQSPFGHIEGWGLISIIIKTNDDLVQEQFAMQIITTLQNIWKEAGLPLQLKTYKILALSSNTGIMETVSDVASISSIKKKLPLDMKLRKFFTQAFGQGTTELMKAQNNFLESLAATSLVCYFLQVKDRHNGNILLDREGRIVHVDFGWILDNTMPFNLEFAPFKLTEEMIDILGGDDSPLYLRYKKLCVDGFIEARKKHEQILDIFEIMVKSNLVCITPTTLDNLRQRFNLNSSEEDCRIYVNNLIDYAKSSYSTNIYDAFQKYYANIN